jgi:mannose-6-phosphate isomerase
VSAIALRPALQHYDWGSPTAIPHLLGEAGDGRPVAELWVGAHHRGPALAALAQAWVPLDELVASDPVAHLGRAAEMAEGQVPFLVKILAADAPLSLQAHPDAVQARAGFLDEEVRGIARTDPRRRYHDPSPKPELLCALGPFRALCGLRPEAAAAAVLEEAGARPWARLLRAEGHLAVLEALWDLPADEQAALVDAVSARHPLAAELAARFPGDVGCVAALLLHEILLEPGEALFLPARTLHAYLGGLGVEVMASSDNVLRAGLTTKPTDPAELMRVLDGHASPPTLVSPDAHGTYRAPTPWFELQRLHVHGPARLPHDGPALVLGLAGDVVLDDLTVDAGGAAWLPASAAAGCIDGHGELAVVRLPL